MGNNCVGSMMGDECITWPYNQMSPAPPSIDHKSVQTLPPEFVIIIRKEVKNEVVVVVEPKKSNNSMILRKPGPCLNEDFDLGKMLGKGQYGTTFACTEKRTGIKFACKSISKKKLVAKDDIDDVRREIEIMHHLSGNPNVVSIKGAYEDSASVHLVMEMCGGGELFDRINKLGRYSERDAATLARTIVGVVEFCHSLGVMHRDLKPENFLFVNKDDDCLLLKVIDFGLSVFFKPGERFSEVVGSPYYIAPEVLCKNYGPEADMWSVGIIIYILLCGVPPFWAETDMDIFREILHGELDFSSDPWPNISETAKDLVQKMLVRDPKKRITPHEALCHPWLSLDSEVPNKPLDSAVLGRLTQFSAMNKLKKMAFRVIAENLCEEDTAGSKELFQTIDTDGSGQITIEELKAGLIKHGANLAESQIYDLLHAADIDESGTIDYFEFVAATLHLNKLETEDNLLAAFSYFDKDGSGYITPDELEKAWEDFGIKEDHFDDIIQEADQNNDGRIDYSEFLAMITCGRNADAQSVQLQNSVNVGFRDTGVLVY